VKTQELSAVQIWTWDL